MRLLRLCITTLALTFCASALAQEGETPEAQPFGVILTCSAAIPSGGGCFVERPIYVLGGFEIALGLDARYWRGEPELAAYLTFAYYAPSWAAWFEVRTPEIVRPVGSSDWVRLGLTLRL